MARRHKAPPDAGHDAPPVPGSVPEAQPMIDLSDFEGQESEARNDIFVIDPIRWAKLQKEGIDTRITRVRIQVWRNDKRVKIPGELAPEQARSSDLLRRWGPGLYELAGCNEQGVYIAGARINVDDPRAGAAPSPAFGVPPPPAAASGAATFEQQLLQTLLAKALAAPAPAAEADPMRDAMAAIVKGMAVQQQMMSQALQLQMQLQNTSPEKQQGDRMWSILEGMIKRPNPTNGGGAGGFAEFLPILQWGMQLGRATVPGAPAVAAADPDAAIPPWLRMVPEVADTVGVPLIVTIAQAVLPPEKAKIVIDAISEHQKARKAEAEADAAAAGDVHDTTGEAVP